VGKPVSALLERSGATEAEELAVHALLSDMVARAQHGDVYAPSLTDSSTICLGVSSMRGNREFVSLLLDTLKVDRPAYQNLHTCIAQERWPQWS
jgi:hypothetical protein